MYVEYIKLCIYIYIFCAKLCILNIELCSLFYKMKNSKTIVFWKIMYIKYTELCTLFKMFCTLNTKKKKKKNYVHYFLKIKTHNSKNIAACDTTF